MSYLVLSNFNGTECLLVKLTSPHQYCRLCETQKYNNYKDTSDFHSVIIEAWELEKMNQRAKVVIKLAHISKKSMV